MRFKAVTFDVDGTLYDFRELAKVMLPQAILKRRFFKAYMAAREEVRQAGMVGDVRSAQCVGIASRMRCTADEASDMTARYIETGWDKFARVNPIKGVREVLEACVAAGVPLGLISDYPAKKKVDGLGFGDLPWAVEVAAEGLGALKPHKIAYETALDTLGVEAADALHVGDRLDADIGGAKAIGMSAALFTAGNSRQWPGIGYEPDFTFDNYTALLEYLE